MRLLHLIFFLFGALQVISQSSTISSSHLQIPSLSSTQIQEIVSPQKGMMVFDNELKTLRTFDGTKWGSGNAQSSNFESQNMSLFRGNANNNDNVFDMKTDANGNVYVLTTYRGTVTYGNQTFTNNHPIASYVGLVKFNPDGQILWANDLGNGTSYGPLSIDNTGNVFVGGHKYLANGTREYANDLPFLKPTFTPNGNAYGYQRIEGYSQTINNVTFGCPNGTNPPNNNGIFAYDANKNLLWVKHACAGDIFIDGTFTDATNNCYFTGYFYNGTFDFSGGTDPNAIISTTSRKHFVGKLSANGIFQWIKTFQNIKASTEDAITHVLLHRIDSEGNLILLVGFNANDLYYNESVIVNTNSCVSPQNYIAYGNAIELKINSSNGSLNSTQQGFANSGYYSEQQTMITNNNIYNIKALPCPLSNEICPPILPQAIILKRNKANEVIWTTKTKATLNAIATGKGKSVWIAGSFTTGNLTFGSVSLTTSQANSMFLLRIKE